MAPSASLLLNQTEDRILILSHMWISVDNVLKSLLTACQYFCPYLPGFDIINCVNDNSIYWEIAVYLLYHKDQAYNKQKNFQWTYSRQKKTKQTCQFIVFLIFHFFYQIEWILKFDRKYSSTLLNYILPNPKFQSINLGEAFDLCP